MTNRREPNGGRGVGVRRSKAKDGATVVALRTVNQAKVLELVASGLTVTDAAKSLGIDRTVASKLFNDALAESMQQTNDLRGQLVAQELETLRLLKRKYMLEALKGSEPAARVVLGIVDRTSRLLGLDAAIKVEISNQRVEDAIGSILDLVGDDRELPSLLELDGPPLVIDAEGQQSG